MNGSSETLPTPFDNGEVYDLILKDIPYGFDFYTGLAKEAKGPVLDVCCGTGRILLPCLVDMYLIDARFRSLASRSHR